MLFSFVFSGMLLFCVLRIAKFRVLLFYTSVKDTNRQIYTSKSRKIIIFFESLIGKVHFTESQKYLVGAGIVVGGNICLEFRYERLCPGIIGLRL